MRKYFLCLIIFLIASLQIFSQMIQVGEELTYEVSYLKIKLGTVRIVTLPDTVFQGEKVYHSKVFIRSNPGIPFYSLRAIFNSFMDTTLTEGKFFEANTQENNNEWGYQKITFQKSEQKNKTSNDSRTVRVEKWFNNEKINDTIIFSEQSGLKNGLTMKK